MEKTKKIRLALELYPFYEAVSGDLQFFSVIKTLFYIQVKGLSAFQIATILLLTNIADLALEYPSYRIIRRLGNSRASVIGGIMPLIGIILITFGQTLPIIGIGNIFFVSSGNFQSMASAGARNNLMLVGEKDQYTALFSKGTKYFTMVSLAAAIVIPFLFSYNSYLPSAVCIITYTACFLLSFFLRDYTEDGGLLTPVKEQKESPPKIGRGLWLLLIVFCMFFCAGAVFTDNTEVFMSSRLGELFSKRETIFIYGAVIWAVRVVRVGSASILPRILDLFKEKIVIIATSVMLAAFLLIGSSGLLFENSLIPILTAGTAYIIVKGIFWDPLRTFLRMTAVDTNSKKRQQSMMVLLNGGQSVFSVVMDLIVVGILKILSLEYVFLTFALISVATVSCAVLFLRELKKSSSILEYNLTLNESEIDAMSQRMYDSLTEAGIDSKDAAAYRLLTEEKLMECMAEGRRGEALCVSVSARLDDILVSLKSGDEERDIFSLPLYGDEVSQIIFQHLIKHF